MHNEKANFRSKFFVGLRWSALTSWYKAFFSIIVPIIMARLLTPDDFGLIAMATVFTGISQVFIDLGTGAALIQKKDLDIYFISSIFWLNIMLGLFVWMILILIAPYVAHIYDKDVIQLIIYLLSINILLSSYTITYRALLEKDLNFSPIAISQIISQTIGSVVGITMAILNCGVWSLVCMNIVYQLLFTMMLIIFTNWKPKLSFHINHIKEIFSFSSYLTLAKFFNHFQRESDKFIVGYYLGSQLLGIYSKAYGLLRKPVKTINGFVAPVMYPAMSSLIHNPDKIKSLYLNAIQAFAMIYLPVTVILILFYEPLVLIILGEKWLQMAPLLPVFGIIICYQSLDKANPITLKSLGRTDLQFKINIVFTPIMIVGCLIGVKFGIYAVAIAYLLTTFLLFLIRTFITLKLIKVNIAEYLLAIVLLLVYAITMCIVAYMLNSILRANFIENELINTSISISASTAIYFGLLIIRPIPAFHHLMEFFKIKPFELKTSK